MARPDEIDLFSPCVVGVVNATPDSFSDAGPRGGEAAIERGLGQIEDGAAIIEVGGESNVSNRPRVPADEEAGRVVPVIERLAAQGAVISIDTHKPEVARAAIDAGASIVNDISGLGVNGVSESGRQMIELCADAGVRFVLMHTETPPKTPRWEEGLYPDGVGDGVMRFFEDRLELLSRAGIDRDRVILDPGPDFAKTPRQTVEALRAIPRYTELGCPIMLAVSRKDFIGAIANRTPRERSGGTFAAVAHGVDAGATVLRVHDVAGTVDFLRIREALAGREEVDPSLRITDEIRREPVG